MTRNLNGLLLRAPQLRADVQKLGQKEEEVTTAELLKVIQSQAEMIVVLTEELRTLNQRVDSVGSRSRRFP